MTEVVTHANADQPFTIARGVGRLRTPHEVAATRPNPQNIPDDLRAALESLGSTMAGDSRDWATNYRDAWLYGIVLGWDCDKQHDHNEIDCSNALASIAAQHGWSGEQVDRLRFYHRAVLAALGELDGED